MEVNLFITVHTSDNEISLKYTKAYQSDMTPSIGAKIKDSLFAEYKRIIEVIYDYSENKCFVTLEPRVETKERLGGHIQEVAKLHHWILVNKN